MSQKDSKVVTNLHEFLADSDGLTKQEVATELRASGVDVNKFNADIRSIVSAAQSELAQPAFKHSSADVRIKTRAEILDLLARIQQGVFGNEVAELLAARQHIGSSLGERDLQALLDATHDQEPDKN